MPAVQPPRINTLDYGAAVGTAESIKGQRLKNALSGLAIEDHKRSEAERNKVKAIRAQTENAGEAINQLRADGLHEQADQLQQQSLGMFTSTIDMLKGVSDMVTDSDSYDQLRSGLLQAGAIDPEDMPVEYESSFLSKKLKEAQGKLSVFEQVVGTTPEGARILEQVTQDTKGREVARSPEYTSATDRNSLKPKGGEGDGGLQSGDASLLLRAAGQIYGGFYDPVTGQFAGLDKDEALNVQRLAERAERHFIEGAGHNQAVAKAARELGIKIQGQPGEPDPNDPFGLNQ